MHTACWRLKLKQFFAAYRVLNTMIRSSDTRNLLLFGMKCFLFFLFIFITQLKMYCFTYWASSRRIKYKVNAINKNLQHILNQIDWTRLHVIIVCPRLLFLLFCWFILKKAHMLAQIKKNKYITNFLTFSLTPYIFFPEDE